MLNFFLTKKVVVKFILFYSFFTNYLSQKGFCAPSDLNRSRLECDLSLKIIKAVHGLGHHIQCLPETAHTSPTCRRFQRPSHQVPDRPRPSTQPVYLARPSPGYDADGGTRSEDGVLSRYGGLDPGSVSGEDKVYGTSIRSVPNGEYNVDDS